jgi:hypothetical protein
MNILAALQTIIGSAKNHPWLLGLVIVALIAHAADLQWPQFHKLLSTTAYGLFAIAFIYAGGSSNQPPPVEPPKLP